MQRGHLLRSRYTHALTIQMSISTATFMLEETKSSLFPLMQCYQVAYNAKLTHKDCLVRGLSSNSRGSGLISVLFTRWLFNTELTGHASSLVSHPVAPSLLPQARAGGLHSRLLQTNSIHLSYFSALLPFSRMTAGAGPAMSRCGKAGGGATGRTEARTGLLSFLF